MVDSLLPPGFRSRFALVDTGLAHRLTRLNLRKIPRPNFLIAVAVVAFLFLMPSGVSAQRVIPHAFLGSATVNGFPAADGTVVAALVDGRQVAAKTVSGGSYPVLLVEPDNDSFAGKTVTFTIGGIPANETALWVQGQVTELNLSASPAPDAPTATPVPAPTPTPVIVVGEKGEKGEKGETGETGQRGAQGPQGVQGPSGPPGVGGPPGSAGASGPAGVAGPTGSQGLTGPEGDSGDKGSSLFGILAFVVAIFAFLGTFGGMLWRRLVE